MRSLSVNPTKPLPPFKQKISLTPARGKKGMITNNMFSDCSPPLVHETGSACQYLPSVAAADI